MSFPLAGEFRAVYPNEPPPRPLPTKARVYYTPLFSNLWRHPTSTPVIHSLGLHPYNHYQFQVLPLAPQLLGLCWCVFRASNAASHGDREDPDHDGCDSHQKITLYSTYGPCPFFSPPQPKQETMFPTWGSTTTCWLQFRAWAMVVLCSDACGSLREVTTMTGTNVS